MMLVLIGITLGSWLGWWIGARFGIMTGYILSTIGGGVGLYWARKIKREYMP